MGPLHRHLCSTKTSYELTQGTLFYTYLGPSVIAQTINQLGFDAITLGNHEFDGGNEPLVKWIKELNFPMICANVNTTDKSLEEALVPYKVFPEHQLAIVAVTTPEIPGISKPDEGAFAVSSYGIQEKREKLTTS